MSKMRALSPYMNRPSQGPASGHQFNKYAIQKKNPLEILKGMPV